MTTASGVLQNTRAMAVQQNKTKTACHYNRSTAPYSLVYFVKDVTTCTSSMTASTTDIQVEMEAPITPYGAPTGTGAPAVIDDATLGMTSDPLTSVSTAVRPSLAQTFSVRLTSTGAEALGAKPNEELHGSGIFDVRVSTRR